jgi:plasmid maintenance system antidote protein VapI
MKKTIEQIAAGQSVIVDGHVWRVTRAFGNATRFALAMERIERSWDLGTRKAVRLAFGGISRERGTMIELAA